MRWRRALWSPWTRVVCKVCVTSLLPLCRITQEFVFSHERAHDSMYVATSSDTVVGSGIVSCRKRRVIGQGGQFPADLDPRAAAPHGLPLWVRFALRIA